MIRAHLSQTNTDQAEARRHSYLLIRRWRRTGLKKTTRSRVDSGRFTASSSLHLHCVRTGPRSSRRMVMQLLLLLLLLFLMLKPRVRIDWGSTAPIYSLHGLPRKLLLLLLLIITGKQLFTRWYWWTSRVRNRTGI